MTRISHSVQFEKHIWSHVRWKNSQQLSLQNWSELFESEVVGKDSSNCTEILFLQPDCKCIRAYAVECEKRHSHTVSQMASNSETRCHSCRKSALNKVFGRAKVKQATQMQVSRAPLDGCTVPVLREVCQGSSAGWVRGGRRQGPRCRSHSAHLRSSTSAVGGSIAATVTSTTPRISTQFPTPAKGVLFEL